MDNDDPFSSSLNKVGVDSEFVSPSRYGPWKYDAQFKGGRTDDACCTLGSLID